MNYFITILIIFVIIYFFILISTYVFQRNLLYNSNENNYSGDKLDVSIIKVKITTQDDIELLSSLLKHLIYLQNNYFHLGGIINFFEKYM